MFNHAHPTLSSAAASTHGAASPALELCDARQARDGLATLLRAERSAAAEFLLALAHFDRNRGWEVLGHASLFAFLNVELGLSKGGAFFRQTAARLLQRFPDLIDPLRDGRLCITTVFELSKVLTEANRTEVVPRFFGCSSQQARELVATLAPVTNPPVRAVVTLLESPRLVEAVRPSELVTPAALELQAPQAIRSIKTVQSTELSFTQPERVVASRDDVEPLTADLRRLHITVDAQFLKMLDTARDGLSHRIPGASTSPPRSPAQSGNATVAAARGRSTAAAPAARRTGWSSTTSSRGRAGAARRSMTSGSCAEPTTPWRRGGPSETGARRGTGDDRARGVRQAARTDHDPVVQRCARGEAIQPAVPVIPDSPAEPARASAPPALSSSAPPRRGAARRARGRGCRCRPRSSAPATRRSCPAGC